MARGGEKNCRAGKRAHSRRQLSHQHAHQSRQSAERVPRTRSVIGESPKSHAMDEEADRHGVRRRVSEATQRRNMRNGRAWLRSLK